jgi:hypothetical protein
LQDTAAKISLKLTRNKIGVCLNIIQTDTFEAKYAQLILEMKKKMVKLLPSHPPQNQGTEQEE